MARVAFMMTIRPEHCDEYDRVHANVPQPVLDAIKASGARNYPIYRNGNRVFGYYECDDAGVTKAEMDIRQREAGWDEPVLPDVLDPDGDGFVFLPEVYRLD